MPKKRIYIVSVFLLLIAVSCVGTSSPMVNTAIPEPGQVSDVNFKTPEEAITHYFEGIALADANKILQACAVDEMAKGFKFDLYTERINVFIPATSLSPADYPLYVETNKMHLSAQIFDRVRIFTYSLLSNENVEDNTIQMDIERINSFMKDVDPSRLAHLEVKKIGLPNKTLMEDARYQENAAKMASIYGADESTERVALFSYEQKYYYLGFTLLRYGTHWKISSQTSPLANTNALGAPQSTTVEEFESMINGD